MAASGWRVALVGATGAVGEELLQVLGERRFPVASLHAFASEESRGTEIEFQGDPIPVEPVNPDRIADSEVVFCAAPRVLEGLREKLAVSGVRVIDMSGVLELDPEVPVYLSGYPLTRGLEVAIPRGVVAGLGLSLKPLATAIERASIVTLESASGAGRRGVGELSDQTVQLLNAMTGDPGEPEVFPEPLAFDCLPIVGDLLDGADTGEERRLGHVLRRLLGTPGLTVESTRVRVPIFGGSLAAVHLGLARGISLDEVVSTWEKASGVDVLERDLLPTPRTRLGQDGVAVGRIRSEADPPALSFVLAMDDLRSGAAVAAVEVAEILVAD